MAERARRSAGATVSAARVALGIHSKPHGIAANIAGGTHHSYAHKGGGFCVFNDAAVAARLMQAEWARAYKHARKPLQVAVIDLDVHQGNGTAAILAGDDSVFTFSIHGANNFPFSKERSDLDIELADGTGDTAYQQALERGLGQSLSAISPQLVIYLAGADPYEGDRLGRLKLSKAGLLQRDALVLSACRERGIAVAVVMAGGYAREIADTVEIHAGTILSARKYFG